MAELNKRQEEQVVENNKLGIKLLRVIYSNLLDEIEEQSDIELDEHGDLNVRKDFVNEEVIQKEEVTKVLEKIIDTFWDDALDRVTYEVRQYHAEQAELERTNRAIDSSIKNQTVKNINKNIRD